MPKTHADSSNAGDAFSNDPCPVLSLATHHDLVETVILGRMFLGRPASGARARPARLFAHPSSNGTF